MENRQLSTFHKHYQIVVYRIGEGYNVVVWNNKREIVLHREFDVSYSMWIQYNFEGITNFMKWYIDNLLVNKDNN